MTDAEIASDVSARHGGVHRNSAFPGHSRDGRGWRGQRDGNLRRDIESDQIQPASIDLRLGSYAYPVDTSFLPGRGVKVLEKMEDLDPDFQRFKIDLTNGAVLEKGRVYVVPLAEFISLKSEVAAFANPKSSTGRLDILTRLIADGATHFDQVEDGYKGQLYIEIAPRSFSVVVKSGTRLNQLRFRRTRGSAARPITAADWTDAARRREHRGHSQRGGAKARVGDRPGMLPFTVDLEGARRGDSLIGWRAKKNTTRIDLERRDYDPLDFWEPLYWHKQPSLTLVPDEFYILMTKEAIAVPPSYAAEMLPYDTRAGEFRVHYAGFFDPGFGWNPATGKAGSSRGVLEVRSHEVPFLLEHGQTVGWLRYERMAQVTVNLVRPGNPLELSGPGAEAREAVPSSSSRAVSTFCRTITVSTLPLRICSARTGRNSRLGAIQKRAVRFDAFARAFVDHRVELAERGVDRRGFLLRVHVALDAVVVDQRDRAWLDAAQQRRRDGDLRSTSGPACRARRRARWSRLR